MNAISPVVIFETEAAAQRPHSRWDPDVFRSRLLDKFAEVEAWAVGRLRAAQPSKKIQPTLGLRLGAVRELTDTQPALFKNANTVAKLIDDLRPFHDIRSALAHSKLTICMAEGLPVAIFDRADSDGQMPWRDRITLREDDGRQIIVQVSRLANQLRQQIPRPPNPSGPPRPSPA